MLSNGSHGLTSRFNTKDGQTPCGRRLNLYRSLPIKGTSYMQAACFCLFSICYSTPIKPKARRRKPPGVGVNYQKSWRCHANACTFCPPGVLAEHNVIRLQSSQWHEHIIINIYAVISHGLANPKATHCSMLSFRPFVTSISKHLGGVRRRQRLVMWTADWNGYAIGATAFSGLINAVRIE